jgi:mannose-6-phosphate isomerase-like protein (cupin superfamily)
MSLLFVVMAALAAVFAFASNNTVAYAASSNNTTSDRNPLLAHPGEGYSVSIPGEIFTFITRNSDTDGAYSTWELLVSPNSGPPLHKHDAIEESFEVLEGEITAEIDGKTYFAVPIDLSKPTHR